MSTAEASRRDEIELGARETPVERLPEPAPLALVESSVAAPSAPAPVDEPAPSAPARRDRGAGAGTAPPQALDIAVAQVGSPLAQGPVDLLAPLGQTRRRLPAALLAGRIVNMAVMVALIAIGVGVTSDAVALTNLTSFVVWNVWWPLLVVGVFFAARAWCGICHLRLTADLFDRFGLKLKVPKLLKKYGTTVPIAAGVGIFAVHSLVVSYDLHHIPSFTAIFLIGLMVYAAAVALVFEKHSFCKYFCPLVGVLGNYTRVSPTELRSADLAVCKTCRDKSCIKHCQNRLYMGTMDDEQQESCLLCMRCVKHCPHGNIRFSLRPYLQGLWRSPKRTLAGTFAVVVLLGIVIGEVGEEWTLVDSWLLAVPTALAGITGFEQVLPVATGGGYLVWESLWVFILLPLAILAACGAVAYLLARRHKPLEYVQIYGLAFVPLILSLHAAKLVTALNERALYLPGALGDPAGLATADGIAAGTLAPPAALVSPVVWGWLMLGFVVAFGLAGSLYVTWRIARVSFADAPSDGVKTALPFSLALTFLGVVAALTIYTWLISGAGG